ncbi:hypothetical protein QLX08_010211 [Tetragonisca angustula]|uniref:Uncharacterized protein n=1 Tax=Tetragonisca angustula TaxID=166442 RepID=A0AAW0ZDB6_9HYME
MKRLFSSYRKQRNKYSAEIKKAKQDSWEKFVTREGNKQPWSIIYKLQTKRLKLETVQSNICIKGTHTNTWDVTVKTLLNALKPNDEEANETGTETYETTREKSRELGIALPLQ